MVVQTLHTARGFIRSRQPAKTAAYFLQILLTWLKKLIRSPLTLASSDGYFKNHWNPCTAMKHAFCLLNFIHLTFPQQVVAIIPTAQKHRLHVAIQSLHGEILEEEVVSQTGSSPVVASELTNIAGDPLGGDTSEYPLLLGKKVALRFCHHLTLDLYIFRVFKVHLTPKYFFHLNTSLHLFEMHCDFLPLFSPNLDFFIGCKSYEI